MDSTRSALQQQPIARWTLRVVGAVAFGAGLVLALLAGLDFLDLMTSDDFGATPTRFWMFFVAFPLLAAGWWALGAGFLGVSVRYAAAEVAPAAGDTMDFLGAGPGQAGRAPQACRICQASVAAEAKFCEHCGSALVASAG